MKRLSLKTVHLLIVAFVVFAQTLNVGAAQPAETSARLRLGHFAVNIPQVEAVISGEPLGDETYTWANTPYGTLSKDMMLPPGDYNMRVTLPGAGTPPDRAWMREDFTLEAGGEYTLLIYGSSVQDTYNALLINERELLDGVDFTTQGASLYVHNIIGAGAATVTLGDDVMIDALPELGYDLSISGPVEPDVLRVAVANESQAVVSLENVARGAGIYSFNVLSGPYPLVEGESYRYTWLAFFGEVTLIDGGTIAPGDAVEQVVNIGERVRFTLDLEAAAAIDLYLTDPQQVGDPYLRVYDADGVLVAQNDDFTGLDAAVTLDNRPAGTYTVEAASYADAEPGPFLLSVIAR